MHTFLCKYFLHLFLVVSLLYIINFTPSGTRVAVPRLAAFDQQVACEAGRQAGSSFAFGAGKRWTRFESRGKFIFLFKFIIIYY
jgi:hypothetical protein